VGYGVVVCGEPTSDNAYMLRESGILRFGSIARQLVKRIAEYCVERQEVVWIYFISKINACNPSSKSAKDNYSKSTEIPTKSHKKNPHLSLKLPILPKSLSPKLRETPYGAVYLRTHSDWPELQELCKSIGCIDSPRQFSYSVSGVF
jgi:hypothetical protein